MNISLCKILKLSNFAGFASVCKSSHNDKNISNSTHSTWILVIITNYKYKTITLILVFFFKMLWSAANGNYQYIPTINVHSFGVFPLKEQDNNLFETSLI